MSSPVKVLVTGFGPFLDITTNPSWEIARQLPSTLTGLNGEVITIVVPPEPLPAVYHKLFTQVPALVDQHAPDLIVHMGLDVDSGPGVYKIERSAPKEGYHDIPDMERKVVTRAENKKVFGKAATSLVTSLDIDAAVETWRDACSSLRLPNPAASTKTKGKGKENQSITVNPSDNVGTYVCGLCYYIGLLSKQKQAGNRDVVFFHVPRLQNADEVQLGGKVTEALIRALVGVR